MDLVLADTAVAPHIKIETRVSSAPEIFLDTITMRQIHKFVDDDFSTTFPVIFRPQTPPQGFPHTENTRILYVDGLGVRQLGLSEILNDFSPNNFTSLHYSKGYSTGPAIEGMPTSWDDLCDYDAVVLVVTTNRRLFLTLMSCFLISRTTFFREHL